jgi:N-acyl-D-amino-acid deacylase
MHNRREADMRYFLTQPMIMVGSDGRAISPHGLYAKDRPHPRFYGTFPRVLGRYVRDEKVLSLETAIRKMTGLPAQRLGLSDRGRIAEGLVADLVVFDPRTVIDRATFDNPHRYAEGVSHLFVSGKAVIADGKHTGARPGKVLRRER